MCTVILATRVFDAAPVFVASNRDELLDRPASDPQISTHGGFRILAPRDLQEGGTWIGMGENGLMAALTNRFGAQRDNAKRSRGELVVEALQAPSALVSVEMMRGYAANLYNPFHLIIADSTEAFVVWSDGTALTTVALDPGFHVVTERSFGAAETAREALIWRELERMKRDDALSQTDFEALLSIRIEGSMDGTDILVEDWNYGTRSSSFLSIGDARSFRFAQKTPVREDFADFASLLA